MAWLIALAAAAVFSSPAEAQTVSIDLGAEGENASYAGRLVQVFLLITVLSVAPGILVMMTSFIRLVVVFSLLRSALGLQQSPPNAVLISLSLFLTAFIMSPTFGEAWREGVSPMLAEEVDQAEGLKRAAEPFRAFMAAQVERDDLIFFENLSERQMMSAEDAAPDSLTESEEAAAPGFQVLLPAFIISELTRAFEIGFLVMTPFLVIDLAVAAILMSMGMMMLPPQTVSLPVKLVFFVLIDGWRLLSESLVLSFF
jgi:flagellar biosynthetic protein FliP